MYIRNRIRGVSWAAKPEDMTTTSISLKVATGREKKKRFFGRPVIHTYNIHCHLRRLMDI